MKACTLDKEKAVFNMVRTGDMYGFQTTPLENIDFDEKNKEGHSLLWVAVHNGQREFVRYLLAMGANPDSVDNEGRSVLMEALAKGNDEIAKYLLEKGARRDYVNPEGQTAFDFAQIFERNEMVKLLSPESKRVPFYKVNVKETLKSLFK